MLRFALLILAQTLAACLAQDLAASCAVEPNTSIEDLVDAVFGTVTFRQAAGSNNVTVEITLLGFNTTDVDNLHGFHIHEFGDISGGCESTGGHFNPDVNDHGGPEDDVRHAGDFGNIEEDANGSVITEKFDDYISLQSNSTYNVIGRAVVIHQSEDDLGESGDPAGAAGRRIACCVIGATSP